MPPTEIVCRRTVITNMVNAGATGTGEEFNRIADSLTEHSAKAANVNIASVEALVEGLGLASKDAGAIVQFRDNNGPSTPSPA